MFDANEHSLAKLKYNVWEKFGFLSVKVDGSIINNLFEMLIIATHKHPNNVKSCKEKQKFLSSVL